MRWNSARSPDHRAAEPLGMVAMERVVAARLSDSRIQAMVLLPILIGCPY